MRRSWLFRFAGALERLGSRFGRGARSRLIGLFLCFGLPHYALLVITFLFRDGSISSADMVFVTVAISWAWIGVILVWYAIRIVIPIFLHKVRHVLKKSAPDVEDVDRLGVSTQIGVVLWAGACAVAYVFVSPYVMELFGFRSYADPLYILSGLLVVELGVLTGLGFSGIAMVVMLVLDVIRRNRFQIDPYDPDRLGGFSVFGFVTIRGTLFFSSGALFVPILISVGRATSEMATIGAYFLVFVFLGFVLLSFLIPNYAVFKKATMERQRTLRSIGRQLNRIATARLTSNGPEETPADFDSLKTYYEDLSAIRVFPFNPSVLVGLVSSVVFPVFMMYFEDFVSRFLP